MPGYQGHLIATHCTAATAIKAVPGYFYGINVVILGAVTPTFTVYNDPDSATAPVVFKVEADSGSPFSFILPEPVYCSTGIYVDASSWTTAEATVYWK